MPADHDANTMQPTAFDRLMAARHNRARREYVRQVRACTVETEEDVHIAALIDLVSEMDARQVEAVWVFAMHLIIGGVNPVFFSTIADALEGRGASE